MDQFMNSAQSTQGTPASTKFMENLKMIKGSDIVEPKQKPDKMAKKKGFMTPERKKKLRTLLRKKAAEELKKEQERKAEERLRVIAERCGSKANYEAADMDELKKICQNYFDKWYGLEGEMFFLQREVILRDL